MANEIVMISKTEYRLCARGSDMTLVRDGELWEMYVVNAAVRAFRNGHPIPKYFNTLEEVESRYKSWRGIAALVNSCGTN